MGLLNRVVTRISYNNLHAAQLPAPFIVGVPRSGTTLLRLMCDAHPDLSLPPEMGFMPYVTRDGSTNPAGVARTQRIVSTCETSKRFCPRHTSFTLSVTAGT